jgi:hypothetical protein
MTFKNLEQGFLQRLVAAQTSRSFGKMRNGLLTMHSIVLVPLLDAGE